MAKYRAKEDVPPGIVKGQIVDFQEPLVAGYVNKFTPISDAEAEAEETKNTNETAGDNDSGALKTAIINPDRNALKAKARELGINFAENIPTDRLTELLQEAEAKRQAGDGSEGADEDE